jgi:hypothetical protein
VIDRNPQILNATSNLLGICFVVIGGLKLTHASDRTFADEAAWIAAFLFFAALLTSYLAIRNGGRSRLQLVVADWGLILGLFALMISVLIFAVGL